MSEDSFVVKDGRLFIQSGFLGSFIWGAWQPKFMKLYSTGMIEYHADRQACKVQGRIQTKSLKGLCLKPHAPPGKNNNIIAEEMKRKEEEAIRRKEEEEARRHKEKEGEEDANRRRSGGGTGDGEEETEQTQQEEEQEQEQEEEEEEEEEERSEGEDNEGEEEEEYIQDMEEAYEATFQEGDRGGSSKRPTSLPPSSSLPSSSSSSSSQNHSNETEDDSRNNNNNKEDLPHCLIELTHTDGRLTLLLANSTDDAVRWIGAINIVNDKVVSTKEELIPFARNLHLHESIPWLAPEKDPHYSEPFFIKDQSGEICEPDLSESLSDFIILSSSAPEAEEGADKGSPSGDKQDGTTTPLSSSSSPSSSHCISSSPSSSSLSSSSPHLSRQWNSNIEMLMWSQIESLHSKHVHSRVLCKWIKLQNPAYKALDFPMDLSNGVHLVHLAVALCPPNNNDNSNDESFEEMEFLAEQDISPQPVIDPLSELIAFPQRNIDKIKNVNLALRILGERGLAPPDVQVQGIVNGNVATIYRLIGGIAFLKDIYPRSFQGFFGPDALLAWCRFRLEGSGVFLQDCSSFQDGIALCALLGDRFVSSRKPYHESVNLRAAFKLSNDLEIPNLLCPEDFIEGIDPLSLLLFLSACFDTLV